LKIKNRDWFRRKLEAVKGIGYIFGYSVKSVERSFGQRKSDILKLDSNENFFIPRHDLLKIIMEVVEEFDPRLYPQEEDQELREKISSYIRIPADRIVVGNGSDELMERIARLFLEAGEMAVTITPTFSMYRHAVKMQRAELIEVPLNADFSLNVDAILSKVTPKTRVLFLCSPNNPTANQFKTEEIKHLLSAFEDGMVVLDEAYVEFAGSSVIHLTEDFDNLIVLRTFSKAFGLAGLRLGYCIADAEVAETLSRNVGLPYAVNTVALRVGAKILEKLEIVENAIKRLRIERDKLIEALNTIEGVRAFKSETNFVLFHTDKPSTQVYRELLQRGIIIKNLGALLSLENCFRATVGLPEMNVRLVQALRDICETR